MSVIHIVDDEESVRSSLAFLLEIAGFATRTYASADALLARVDALEDGCIVTDLRMPEVNGVELLRRLRAAGTDIPAIVVTGHADVQMAVEAIRHGAFDFIEKPFSDATIIGSLHRAMDGATIVADQRLNAQARVLVDAMSVRERDVMRGVVNGLPNKLIAENLGISPKAVEDHRSSLMERMQVRSLPELVRVTMDLEMLRESDGA
jgi:two-component system response regulator FixJ